MADQKAVFDEVLLAKLLAEPPPTPGGEYVEANFLEPLYAGDPSSAGVLADWLYDNGHEVLSDEVRASGSQERVREHFKVLMRLEMIEGSGVSHRTYKEAGFPSRLHVARGLAARNVLTHFPAFVRSKAVGAVNDFTRVRMREEAFFRRIMPPLQISGDELDRSVDTDLPVKVVDKEP